MEWGNETVPDLPSGASTWMSDPKYRRYVQHYQEMQKWMEEYMLSWKHNSFQFQPEGHAGGNPYQNSPSATTQGYEQWNWPYVHPAAHNGNHGAQTVPKKSQRKSSRKQSHRRNSHRNTRRKNTEDQEMAMEWSEGPEEENNFELEVSEEMKEFFAKSEEFRRERDKAKESGQLFQGQQITKNKTDKDGKSAEKQEKSESELTTSESESREEEQCLTSAPRERPGVRRIVEMKELYGRHAAAIHGMETAIQLQFDRTCDRKQPAYWPIVPLKM